MRASISIELKTDGLIECFCMKLDMPSPIPYSQVSPLPPPLSGPEEFELGSMFKETEHNRKWDGSEPGNQMKIWTN